MRFSTFSHKGTKKQNTDRVEKIIQDGVCAFVVADGGDFCGDIVSELICTRAIDVLKNDLRVDSAILKNCFDSIQAAICDKAKEESGFNNASASCAILVFDGKKVIWGHIGNSRIYFLKNSKVSFVTDDHTNAFKKFLQKEIEFKDIAKYDDGSLIIGINAQNTIEADISPVKKVFKNHSFLLCSDGFWKNIDVEDIQASKKKSEGARLWLSSMLETVEIFAPKDADSISAITITTKG